MKLPRRFGWPAALAVIVLLLVLLAGFIVYRLHTAATAVATAPQKVMTATVREIKKAFGEAAQVQPRIIVNNRVHVEQATGVLELAILSRETAIDRETTHTWLRSTKRIRLRALFEVKIGFDLTEPFTVQVEENRVFAQLPSPKILSVAQKDLEVLAFEDGYWNRINAKDVEREVAGLPAQAADNLRDPRIFEEATRLFAQRLRDKLAPEFELHIESPASKEPITFAPKPAQ